MAGNLPANRKQPDAPLPDYMPDRLPDDIPDVWRGHRACRDIPVQPSGHASLDRHLPGHGWPLGALTELLTGTNGSGEFSLLLPSLAAMTAQHRWVVLLDPPWVPYPPAMRGHGIDLDYLMLIRTRSPDESLWACEQALRGVRGGAVLAWQEDPGFARLRRLQLAARTGQKSAFLFRPQTVAQQASPAALRLQLQAYEAGVGVSILKCRGRRTTETIRIRRTQPLPGSATRPGTMPANPLALAVPADIPGEELPVDTRTH